jgi:hypothetical protein
MKMRLLALLLLWGIAVVAAPGWAQKPAKHGKASMCDCGSICAKAESDAKCKVDRCNGKGASHVADKKNSKKKPAKKPAVSELAAN